ncbi:hypothetical protein [Roseovarius sp.]|uniref:hypothetical protein n=1 Tax=Roseovarius sp. TaxID=1486281 RepID=UPI003D0D9412
MMNRFVRAVAALLISLGSSAAAQGAWDYIILNDSYCTGNGGTSTGMTCSGASSAQRWREIARQEFIREYDAKMAAAQSRADSFESRFLSWLAAYEAPDLAVALDPAADAFVDAEAAERNAEALAKHTHCLHSSLFSLVLDFEQNDLANEAGKFFSGNIGGYTHWHLAYYHLGRIIALTSGDTLARLEIETPEQNAMLRALISEHVANAVAAIKNRLVNFQPSTVSGVRQQESLLYHIGFHPGDTDLYDSPFARMSCKAQVFAGEGLSPQTTAFLRGGYPGTGFDLSRILPPEIGSGALEAYAYADQADALRALRVAARDRPRRTLRDFPSLTGAAHIEFRRYSGYLDPSRAKVVELQEGDIVPDYAALTGGNFVVYDTFFVESFDAMERLPLSDWVRLIVTSHEGFASKWYLNTFVVNYHDRPDYMAEWITSTADKVCRSIKGC